MKKIITSASIFLSMLAIGPFAHSANYTITDLGTVSVVDINNSGQILGNSSNGAIIWDNGYTNNLGSFTATSINNTGQVVGYQGGVSSPPSNLIKWENGSANTISANPGWDFISISLYNSKPQINDSGTIYATIGNGTAWVGSLSNGSSNWVRSDSPPAKLEALKKP